MPSKAKRVLVAGFDAFDKLSANPSQTIVETLEPSLKLPGSSVTVQLETLVLPTCCIKAWTKLKRKLDANSGTYDAIVLTGVAAVREKISLERFALNIRDYRIKDNGGHQYEEKLVDKNGPDALRTSIAILNLRKRLTKKGVLCEVSNHAGTFICNEIYYKCLLYAEKQQLDVPVLFVHLPLAESYARIHAATQTAANGKRQTPASHTSVDNIAGTKSSKADAIANAKGIELMRDAVKQIIGLAIV